MGMWPPAAAKAASPIGQLVVTVHLWSMSKLASGVKVHGQTLTLDFCFAHSISMWLCVSNCFLKLVSSKASLSL